MKHCRAVFYAHFLDVSKAFDKLNHWILLNKDGVNALVYWYQTYKLCVTWGNILLGTFSTSNGIKQGDSTSKIV